MATFAVEAVQKQDRLGPTGDAVATYVVWLKTALGAKGRIEVPVSVWEGDGLREHLQAEADNLDKAFVLINGG